MGENVLLVDDYEVNPYTLCLFPFEEGLNVYTKIYELDAVYISTLKPLEIVKNSCEYFACSYEGRKNGTRRLTGITHKPPIIVDSHTSIYLFPTTSPLKADCVWISHDHIQTHKKIDSHSIKVIFRNRLELPIFMSEYSYKAQMMRTATLRFKFSQQIDGAKKRSFIVHERSVDITDKQKTPERIDLAPSIPE
jgi:competence protein ComK